MPKDIQSKDVLFPTDEQAPWHVLSPKCVLFDTTDIGNFQNKWVPNFKCYESVAGVPHVWVLKTPALNFFDIDAHFLWADSGFRKDNFMALVRQEYLYEIKQLEEKGHTQDEIYEKVAGALVHNRDLVSRFPLETRTGTEYPDPQEVVVYLNCKKTQPITDVTTAVIHRSRPSSNVAAVQPGLKVMNGKLRGK